MSFTFQLSTGESPVSLENKNELINYLSKTLEIPANDFEINVKKNELKNTQVVTLTQQIKSHLNPIRKRFIAGIINGSCQI